MQSSRAIHHISQTSNTPLLFSHFQPRIRRVLCCDCDENWSFPQLYQRGKFRFSYRAEYRVVIAPDCAEYFVLLHLMPALMPALMPVMQPLSGHTKAIQVVDKALGRFNLNVSSYCT